MFKYLSAAMVAAALLAAPSLVTAAGVAQPVNTPLITQPVADYGAKPTKRPKGYKAYKGGKRYGMKRGYKKYKKHTRHYGRVKVKYGKPGPRPYKAAPPKAYKPAPAKSGY